MLFTLYDRPLSLLNSHNQAVNCTLFILASFCVHTLKLSLSFPRKSQLDFHVVVGGALCCVGFAHSSINVAPYYQQDFLGVLCLFGSRVRTTPAACHAKYEGIVPSYITQMNCSNFNKQQLLASFDHFSLFYSTARLLNHSQLIMCLRWALQGS